MDTKLAALEALGMSGKEAALYLTLLSHGRLTVAELARRANVKRATCYEHLDSLLRRDAVVREPIGKRTYYAATAPQKVLSDFKRRAQNIDDAFADLASLHEKATHRPKVTYYEGKRELKTIYDDLFKTVGDVQSIFPAETFFENFSEEEYKDFDTAVQKHALRTRDLFLADSGYRHVMRLRAENKSTGPTKKLPGDFTSNVDVLVFSDKVALMSLRDLSAIVIENKDIANLFRSIHSHLWKST